ncbi:MAG: hypothetical protein ABI295_12205 [Xanthomarina sp.]
MAQQKGLFKIIGTLDDVNFYIIKGVNYARKAGGGFNGDAIRTKASMVRVRENASEFGHSSTVKKQFRLALLPFLHGIKGRPFHSRMMQLFLGLKALDLVSERGKRRVIEGLKTAKGKRLLKQFEFIPNHKLLNNIFYKASFDWNSQILTVTNFNPRLFKAPKSATHIGITFGVLDFNFESLKSSLEISPTFFLDIKADATSFNLILENVLMPTQMGIAVLGVCYYEVINQEVYELYDSIGARILDCM